MRMTNNKDERREQRKILVAEFPDRYLPMHHDAFVAEYNRRIEKQKIEEYMKNRGII